MKTCILAIQRYENIKDIEEWLDYHFNLGFDHIFLMDNNDEKDALQINKENLTILPAYDIHVEYGDSIWQCNAYNKGLDYIRNLDEKYEWIAIIDIDEFIYFLNYKSINEFITNECINKGKDNIELKWKLYDDNNLIYSKESYYGNIQKTFTRCFPITDMNYNDYNNFYSMKHFVKFIGKLKPELYFSNSPHYPAKELYDVGIYQWNLCDYNIAVINHYKYKTLEDFIAGKCKYRNYNKSQHGSAWKYSRTYFEDNLFSINKIFHFIMFNYKYGLNMEQWDIEYLHELLERICKTKKWFFDIWFGKDIKSNQLINDCLESRKKYCKDFYIFYLNESNLNLDICPYVRFMYDHKLYGLCADFFKFLFLYYFGGIYADRDIEFGEDITLYFENNDYMLFDASFHNIESWFTNDNMFCSSFMMSKPFNPIFKQFIDYCNSFTYEQLEKVYNKISKYWFLHYFYDVKIIYNQIIKKYNYKIHILNDISDISKIRDGNIINVYDNILLECVKYNQKNTSKMLKNKKIILCHYNLQTHEDIFLNDK